MLIREFAFSSSSSMESSNWVLKFAPILLVLILCSSSPVSSTLSPLHPAFVNTTIFHRDSTAISEFRTLNRRHLEDCSASNPSLHINVTPNSRLSDEEFVTVTVTGVSSPSDGDWVAMISPSNSE